VRPRPSLQRSRSDLPALWLLMSSEVSDRGIAKLKDTGGNGYSYTCEKVSKFIFNI
jgi:hypothetical protein